MKIQKQAIIATVLIVTASVLGNELIFKSTSTKLVPGVRSPASQILADIRSGTQTAERNLASQLANSKSRLLASLGHYANPLDQFRFGILEGKYALSMAGERIKDIVFIDTPNSEGSPARIVDRTVFLKNYASILSLKNKIERVAVDIDGRKIVETYKAQFKDDNREVLVKIELDELDRLYSIKL